MAYKNYELDGKITASAAGEFLQHGYEKASLRKIAAGADVTIGAIYTRYKNKDALFCALTENLRQKMESLRQEIFCEYKKAAAEGLEQITAVMQHECDMLLHLMYDRYQEARLLFCRSTGSSLADYYSRIMEQKQEDVVAAFSDSARLLRVHLEPEALRILISSQFACYLQILYGEYSPEEARKITDTTMRYHIAGWTKLLRDGK